MRSLPLLSGVFSSLLLFSACSSDDGSEAGLTQPDTGTETELPNVDDDVVDNNQGSSDTETPDTTPSDTDDATDSETDTASDTDGTSPDPEPECATPCTNGFVCQNNTCVCPSPNTDCGGSCVDLTSSQEHCGACFQPALPETCDGIDNDCNGLIDDELPLPINPCELTNEHGTCSRPWVCSGEFGWTCDSATPDSERCDGIDNNCNGLVDEGFLNPVTQLYDRDTHCGDCATNCVTRYQDTLFGYGHCNSEGTSPTCELVCCTATDSNGRCDGFDYVKNGNTCERVTVACTTNTDCQNHFVCNDGICAPSQDRSFCESNRDCPSGDSCIGGVCGCAGDVFHAEAVPPNVMIVLDRSGSMGTNATSKWAQAVTAIKTLVNQHQTDIRFGLTLYPGNALNNTSEGGSCSSGITHVEVGPNNATHISQILDSAAKGGSTPTAAALARFLNYPALEDPGRTNHLILITDGESTCNNSPIDETQALFDKSVSLRTFVIGFGSGVSPEELNSLAQAGGTARQAADGRKYYQADNHADLSMALQSIAGSVMGCEYALTQAPPSAQSLSVYLNGQEQTRDTSHTNGWDINTNTNRVSFYGPMCDYLRATRENDRLVFVYGCPNPIIINP